VILASRTPTGRSSGGSRLGDPADEFQAALDADLVKVVIMANIPAEVLADAVESMATTRGSQVRGPKVGSASRLLGDWKLRERQVASQQIRWTLVGPEGRILVRVNVDQLDRRGDDLTVSELAEGLVMSMLAEVDQFDPSDGVQTLDLPRHGRA
jgi:hypothetical protein